MDTVIVTMTTVPTRLNDPNPTWGIRPGLKTVLEQTGVEYEMHLNIPYSHKGKPVIIPDWMLDWQKKYKHLKIFRCTDYGSITKIYPTLQRITDPETIIITAEDDLFYHDGFIKSHLEARNRYPEYAIGYAGIGSIDETQPCDSRGVHPTGKYYFTTSTEEDVRVRVLESYKTISYRRRFFSDDFDQFAFMHWNDDEVISAYLGYKNIKKISLKCENCENNFSPRVETYPVIGHVPISGEVHGCNIFRQDEAINKKLAHIIIDWHKLGYMER